MPSSPRRPLDRQVMMNVAVQRSAAEAAYVDAFARLPEPLRRGSRKAAFESFAAVGLPHRRLEDWKWTDLRQLLDRAYPPLAEAVKPAADAGRLIARSPFAGIARARLVFVDGRFDAQGSSLPRSGDVAAAALGSEAGTGGPSGDPISALNLAFFTDGARIRIGRGSTLDAPIELIFVSTVAEPSTVTTRNVIEVEEGASATVLEYHVGRDEAYVANSVTEVRLGKGARFDRVKVIEDGGEAVHLANFEVRIGERASLRDFTLTEGGRAVRQQGFVTFEGEHAEARIGGTYLLGGSQHADTRLVVDHAVPHCTSRELFKCVMDGNARGVFQGKVVVRQKAQKTDGKQSSHGLLLSPTAEFDTKPELEIFADDVVCGHGATSGELNEDHLFYLRARGIPEEEAKSLLIAAFAAEAFDFVENEAVRDALTGLAASWLARRRK